jgi:hypothetical protein
MNSPSPPPSPPRSPWLSASQAPDRPEDKEYFLFHPGFSADEDNDVCLLKIRSGDKIIFIRYSFTLLCSPGHFAKLPSITELLLTDTPEILYKMPNGQVARLQLTEEFCKNRIPPHIPLTVDDIKVEGSSQLYDYDELVIQRPNTSPGLFNDDSRSVSLSEASGISGGPAPSLTPMLQLVESMRPVTRSTTLPNEFNNLAGFIVEMYGLSDAIQVSLGKLHNSLNQVLTGAPDNVVSFTDVVCLDMSTFCSPPTGTGTGSKSFDMWMNESPPDRKNALMCLKSAYVSRAENSCKVHDKPESEIVKKMTLVRPDISLTLTQRGCSTYPGIIGSMLTEMDDVFKKHFGSYVSPSAKSGGGVSQEKCRLAITDYQSSFSAAMERLGCPIPRYDRLGEINRTRTSRVDNAAKNINRTRTSRVDNAAKNINLGFDVAVSDGADENIADSMVKNGQALVCDAINYQDFPHVRMIAHLNSSEIDAARLSLNITKPLVILIESPDYSDDGNTRTRITPIPCNFTPPLPNFQATQPRELHEGDGGLFVFLSIPWFEPEVYTRDNWFQGLSPDEKSKVIRPIICVYKITASFPPGQGYDAATNVLCDEFIASLQSERSSLISNPKLFKDECRVPEIRPSIRRLGVEYSFVFGITTTRGGVSNNLTLALILPHLAHGGGAKCFRGTCDARECIKLLENSGCSYLKLKHFGISRSLFSLLSLSLTELNFLLGLILKEYGDSTKALCAEIMRSLYNIPTVLASVDWCLLLRQFEGVAAFRSDNVYKICGTTELKPLEPDEIRKIATLQALFMCYPEKSGLTTAEGLHHVLGGLQVDGAAAAAATAAGRSYDVFQTHIGNKIRERVIRRITDSLSRFRAAPTLDVLPDYCEFVLFHSKLQSSNFLIEKDKFIDMMSKPVTSHGHHVCHDMLDFFDKYVIDTRKIDSFEYERMKLMEIKEDGAIDKLLNQLINVPIHNPYVQKLLLQPPQFRETDKIIKQTESDLVGVFSNCSLFELLLLVAYYHNNPGYKLSFKTDENPAPATERQMASAPIMPFDSKKVKELLRPSLWSVFHEFFGAECGIRDYSQHPDVTLIKNLLIDDGFVYLSPDDIVRIREELETIVDQGPGIHKPRVPGSVPKAPSKLKAPPQPIQTPRGTPDQRSIEARGKLGKLFTRKISAAASSAQEAVALGEKQRRAAAAAAAAAPGVGSKRPASKKGGSRKKRTRTYKKMNRRTAAALTRKRRTRRKL